MPEVLDHPRTVPAARVHIVGSLVAAVAMVTALAGLGALVTGPRFVDRLTIRNDTAFAVDIDTAGGDARLLAIGTVEDHSRIVVEDVLDQGDRWTFWFSRAGHDAGRVTVSRRALEQSGWVVAVPAAVEDALVDAGQHPRDEATGGIDG